jgi:heat-inducible transcriptional repressor
MRDEIDLERRQREILATIIRQYVASGAPVGSKAVAEQFGDPLSSATIRSVMAQLEADGYLAQPHVSAGRVPTDKAYRYYVDHMVGALRLDEAIQQYIHQYLSAEAQPAVQWAAQLMAKTSHVLAEVSHSVGLVLGPALEEKILEHVKFIRLQDRRVLVVVVSKPDLVENKVVQLGEEFTQEDLDRAAEYLNGGFRGWSLRTIRVEIFKRLEEMKVVCDHLLTDIATLFSHGALEGEESGPLFVEGTARILDLPDFEDTGKLRELLAAFEQKAKLIRILGACLQSQNYGVRILIGRENTASEMQECTVIMAPLHYRRRVVGALGVVGPVRMEYDRAIKAVEYVAHLCSRLLSSN